MRTAEKLGSFAVGMALPFVVPLDVRHTMVWEIVSARIG